MGTQYQTKVVSKASCNASLISSKEVRYLYFHCVQSLIVLKEDVAIKFGERDNIWGFSHVSIKTLCILQCRLWLLWGILPS